MTEEEAQAWLRHRDVSHETIERLETFRRNLAASMDMQNLIGRATMPAFWSRHIVDSAQLVRFAEPQSRWVDFGSGAGFPGLVIAAIGCRAMTLVESRPLRSAFLSESAVLLAVNDRVSIFDQRLETLPTSYFDVICARAFAPLARLLELGHRFAGPHTRWILPKGRHAADEVASVRDTWQGDFRLEPSITDAASSIIVATDVRPRIKRR